MTVTVEHEDKNVVMGAILALAYTIGGYPPALREAVKFAPEMDGFTPMWTKTYPKEGNVMQKFQMFGGKQGGAMKVVVYGPEGIGKSTLASRFPAPVFIDTEGSTKFLDVLRLEAPTSWRMLLEEVKYIRDDPSLGQTLVLDTLDWAERLCIRSVCDQYQKGGIEAFDYGRGYTFVYEAFGELLNLLTECTEKGLNVVVTAHAATKRREQPDEFGSYDVWSLKLIDTPKCSISNLVKEWGDLVLFANYKTYVVAADEKGKKHKAQGGRRVMYTSHHPCWDAKNRLGLPEELPMEFEPLAAFFGSAAPQPRETTTSAPPPATEPPAAAAPAAVVEPGESGRGSTVADPGGAAPAASTVEAPAPDVPAELRPLMERSGVTGDEVLAVIAERQGRYFPAGTPWEVMEKAGFVSGWVLPNWDKIVDMIQLNRKTGELPF